MDKSCKNCAYKDRNIDEYPCTKCCGQDLFEPISFLYDMALNDLVAELEKIDPCEYASYTLCLVKEKAEELKNRRAENVRQ